MQVYLPIAEMSAQVMVVHGMGGAVGFLSGLFGVGHPKLCDSGNAVLVLSPEHYRIFKDGGWDRRRIEEELYQALKRPGRDLIHGAPRQATFGGADGRGPFNPWPSA